MKSITVSFLGNDSHGLLSRNQTLFWKTLRKTRRDDSARHDDGQLWILAYQSKLPFRTMCTDNDLVIIMIACFIINLLSLPRNQRRFSHSYLPFVPIFKIDDMEECSPHKWLWLWRGDLWSSTPLTLQELFLRWWRIEAKKTIISLFDTFLLRLRHHSSFLAGSTVFFSWWWSCWWFNSRYSSDEYTFFSHRLILSKFCNVSLSWRGGVEQSDFCSFEYLWDRTYGHCCCEGESKMEEWSSHSRQQSLHSSASELKFIPWRGFRVQSIPVTVWSSLERKTISTSIVEITSRRGVKASKYLKSRWCNNNNASDKQTRDFQDDSCSYKTFPFVIDWVILTWNNCRSCWLKELGAVLVGSHMKSHVKVILKVGYFLVVVQFL